MFDLGLVTLLLLDPPLHLVKPSQAMAEIPDIIFIQDPTCVQQMTQPFVSLTVLYTNLYVAIL